MMIFRIQKSFYCDRHSQSREAKKQNTFTRTIILSSMKKIPTIPFLCFAIDSPQNELLKNDEMRNPLVYTLRSNLS